jgi:hypothetical protein
VVSSACGLESLNRKSQKHLKGQQLMLAKPSGQKGTLSNAIIAEEHSLPSTTSPVEVQKGWAIGIYTGDSPLRLSSPSGIQNPVLSYKDVSDARAVFLADPFIVIEEGVWHMFFEVMNGESDKGEIALATSPDGLHWEYRQIVLKEPFHLSYPHVFRWEGDYYMTPETLSANSVCLYKADLFPARWSRIRTIVSLRGADPSVFRFNGMWWMFVCAPVTKSDTLRLYYSPDLMGAWQEHPCSPIIEGDACIARPAGRVTFWDGRLIRFTQDCQTHYGAQVRAFEITRLTPTSYSEKETEVSPVLCAATDGWNSFGMHHVDPHLTNDGIWIACVDGR